MNVNTVPNLYLFLQDGNSQLLQRVHELETTLNEKLNFYKDREIKSEATIQQQTKLIDYLQSKVSKINYHLTVSTTINV